MSTIKKEDTVDVIHGMRVADPYRALEDADNPQIQDWIKEHNERTNEVLKTDSFTNFSDELARNFKVVNFSNPVPVRGRYFYMERQPDDDQAVLYMKDDLDGVAVELFNPNGKRDGNTTSIDYWSESQSGKYIVYGVSEAGDEMATLYVKDVDANAELSDQIPRCRFASVCWLPDDSGFFYTRNPLPGTVPKNEEHLHMKVYLHVLGSDPQNDPCIFGADRPKDDMIRITLSPDGRYLGIHAATTWIENDVYIYDTQTQVIEPLVCNVPAKFLVTFLDSMVLLGTNLQADNYRILQSSYEEMFRPVTEWSEFIPEQTFLLQHAYATKSKILVEYLVNVCSEVHIYNYQGKKEGEIPLPEYSNLTGISARRDQEEFFYGVDSFVFPKISYRYDPDTETYSEYRKTDNPIDPEKYTVTQEWCVSHDDTEVPLFIVHKKGVELNAANPTILSGYGGFGVSLSPAFMRNWVPWLERGGVLAVANIRGGREFGEQWHKSAMKSHKQNSFHDFIAASEYLIQQNYTSSDHLGIIGGSNGGLLVSAVGVQRPDLYAAVCARVPLTDMVRFPKFGIAIRWIHEYGNPKIKEELEHILQWSPYHTVQDGVEYPNFFFTTGEKDTRVDPLHARKLAARLEAVNEHNHVLLFTESDAGHGSGKPILKIVESQALVLSFFAQMLGLR